MKWKLWVLVGVAVGALLGGAAEAAEVEVSISGGYELHPPDRGRPVVLIAAALGVPEDTFRDAFRQVMPAPAGQGPDEARARRNKDVLMSRLAPFGVTNERLDTVSDFYRYNRSAGETWPHTPARIVATVAGGRVTGFTVLQGGAGYTSPPRITVPGIPGVQAVGRLSFGRELGTNGSITSVQVVR